MAWLTLIVLLGMWALSAAAMCSPFLFVFFH